MTFMTITKCRSLLLTLMFGCTFASLLHGGHDMSQQEQADLAYIQKKTEAGVAYQLNLAHEQQYRHVINTLQRNGVTEKFAPMLYKSLRATANKHKQQGSKNLEPKAHSLDHGGLRPYHTISSLEKTGTATYQADSLATVNGGTEMSSTLLEIYNPEVHHIFAAEAHTQFVQGTHFRASVKGSMPTSMKGASPKVQGLFTYLPRDGKPSDLQVLYIHLGEALIPSSVCMKKPNYCVRQGQNCVPGQHQTTCVSNIQPYYPRRIHICYSRGSQQSCDYYHPTPANPPDYQFPVKGNFAFDAPFYEPLTGVVTINIIAYTNGGACNLFFRRDDSLDSQFWKIRDGVLYFDYPAAAFADPNACLDYLYGAVDWEMIVRTSLIGEQPTFGEVYFTSDLSKRHNPRYTIVPALYIEHGCLAEGTEITMADGSLKKVESFTADGTEMLESTNHNGRLVLGTTKGTEAKPMVRLRTKSGHQLMVTETHPVLTTLGAKMARDLIVGELVQTTDAPAVISAIDRVPFKGKVYNLRLSDIEEAETSYYPMVANGILVGDASMQRYLERKDQEKRKVDPKYALDHLAPEWHQDYRNYQAALKKAR